jgi:hypothetical protein
MDVVTGASQPGIYKRIAVKIINEEGIESIKIVVIG